MGLLFTSITKVAPAYPQTVHEHKAPTDESIKLLREMEAKARKEITVHLRATNNAFNGAIYSLPTVTDERQYWVVFSLNGREYEFKERIDGMRLRMMKANGTNMNVALVTLLYERAAQVIARKLMEVTTIQGFASAEDDVTKTKQPEQP